MRDFTARVNRFASEAVLFHLSAHPLITPHARSHSVVRPAASADAHGRPSQLRVPQRSIGYRVPGDCVPDGSARRLGDRASEVPLADGNNLMETLFRDRPDESLGVGIGARRARRRQDHPDAGLALALSHSTAPFPIPSQISTRGPINTPSSAAVYETHHLAHEQISRMWRGPSTWIRREARSMTNTV